MILIEHQATTAGRKWETHPVPSCTGMVSNMHIFPVTKWTTHLQSTCDPSAPPVRAGVLCYRKSKWPHSREGEGLCWVQVPLPALLLMPYVHRTLNAISSSCSLMSNGHGYCPCWCRTCLDEGSLEGWELPSCPREEMIPKSAAFWGTITNRYWAHHYLHWWECRYAQIPWRLSNWMTQSGF